MKQGLTPAARTATRLLLGGAAVAIAGRLALQRWAAAIRSRLDLDLDPLYEPPADVRHRQVRAHDGGRIHLLERGSGRPLVLVHGITLQAGVWAPQLHLMSDRYRVIAMDVRGHGRSVAGTDGLGRAVAAMDVATVLEDLDLRHAVLVGHSMGGMILMELAGRRPDILAERAAGLVLMDTAAYGLLPAPLLAVAKRLGRRITLRHSEGRPVPQLQSGDDDLSLVLSRLAFGSKPSSRAVEQLRRYGQEIPQSSSLPSWIDLLDHDARRALADTEIPALVLVGSRDLLTPVFAARRIVRYLPGARLEVLAGAGHQLMQERPGEVAALIDRFTAQLG